MATSKVKRIVRSNRTATALKVGLTVAAFGAATYSNMLGRRISDARAVQMADEDVSADLAAAMRRQSVLRWVTPALSGGLMVLGAVDRNQRSASRLSRAIDRFAPDIDLGKVEKVTDKVTPDWDRVSPVLDRLAPALDKIGPAIERITPDWVEEHRLPSLAS